MWAAPKILRAYGVAPGARVRSVGTVARYTGIKTRFQRKRFFVLRSLQTRCGAHPASVVAGRLFGVPGRIIITAAPNAKYIELKKLQEFY